MRYAVWLALPLGLVIGLQPLASLVAGVYLLVTWDWAKVLGGALIASLGVPIALGVLMFLFVGPVFYVAGLHKAELRFSRRATVAAGLMGAFTGVGLSLWVWILVEYMLSQNSVSSPWVLYLYCSSLAVLPMDMVSSVSRNEHNLDEIAKLVLLCNFCFVLGMKLYGLNETLLMAAATVFVFSLFYVLSRITYAANSMASISRSTESS